MSSLSGAPLPSDTVYFGELGLSGAIRPVAQAQARLKEAAKLGFSKAVSPQPRKENGERVPLAAHAIGHITDLVAGVAGERPRRGPWVSAAKGSRSRSVLDIRSSRRQKGDGQTTWRYTAPAIR